MRTLQKTSTQIQIPSLGPKPLTILIGIRYIGPKPINHLHLEKAPTQIQIPSLGPKPLAVHIGIRWPRKTPLEKMMWITSWKETKRWVGWGGEITNSNSQFVLLAKFCQNAKLEQKVWKWSEIFRVSIVRNWERKTSERKARFFLYPVLCCSGNCPQEELAKFGY